MPYQGKEFEIVQAQININKCRANHKLHLILTIITCGIWGAAWGLVCKKLPARQAVCKGKLKALLSKVQ